MSRPSSVHFPPASDVSSGLPLLLVSSAHSSRSRFKAATLQHRTARTAAQQSGTARKRMDHTPVWLSGTWRPGCPVHHMLYEGASVKSSAGLHVAGTAIDTAYSHYGTVHSNCMYILPNRRRAPAGKHASRLGRSPAVLHGCPIPNTCQGCCCQLVPGCWCVWRPGSAGRTMRRSGQTPGGTWRQT
jgi:hypothetical protein